MGSWMLSQRGLKPAKNQAVPRSGKTAYFAAKLDAAMANRFCDYGILVAALEKNTGLDGCPALPYLKLLPSKKIVALVEEKFWFWPHLPCVPDEVCCLLVAEKNHNVHVSTGARHGRD